MFCGLKDWILKDLACYNIDFAIFLIQENSTNGMIKIKSKHFIW